MTEVEGVDYSPEAIEQIREELAEHRNASMKVWPEGIAYSVLMSHVIALLARLAEYERGEREKPIRVEAKKRASPPPRTRPQSGLPQLRPPQDGG